ncbi:MAG: penicillin-binding protein 2 [Zetaproteobacteria bacterium]|nr:MAG: penicillin-binding protein 2 [Zetaproteobacteria bacterium]
MLRSDYDYGEKSFSRRAFFIGGVQFIGLGILGARLAWLQIAQGKRYKTLSDKNRINIRMLAPSRGQIVDRFGVPLAVNEKNYRVLIIPEKADDLKKSLYMLQELISVEDDDIRRVIKDASTTAKFLPLIIKEDLSWAEVAKIEVNLPDLPGLFVDPGEVRTYPYKGATAHVIGYVRAVSKSDMTDDPVLKLPGFKIGKTGIEKVYDLNVRGKAGAVEVEVNVVGREIRELKRKDALSGARVTLTLDGELQRFTQDLLATHKSASAVIMDAHTGAIYALASHPSFDPNMFVHGFSQEQWQIMMDDPGLPQTNKAIAGVYPPGSTFKMITALAGLKAGVINKHTTAFCPGYYKLGKDKFHCWKKYGHGKVDLTAALAQSCDTYFYKMSTEVGIDAIADMARRFGLGSKLGFELAEEKSGLITDKKWKRARFGKRWYPGETVVSSIGQGDMRTTPLQLAVMTARMVNGGYAVKPWITGYLGDMFLGRTQWDDIGVSPQHLKMVMHGMDMVVNGKTGTARKSRIEDVGFAMGGKTGTAQVQRITAEQRRLGIKNADLPWKQRHHALFVGYAPTHNPRYVCAVVVEHGVGGSSVAAPLAKELLKQAQSRNPAITKMQPELIEGDGILQPWPPKKPASRTAQAGEE